MNESAVIGFMAGALLVVTGTLLFCMHTLYRSVEMTGKMRAQRDTYRALNTELERRCNAQRELLDRRRGEASPEMAETAGKEFWDA